MSEMSQLALTGAVQLKAGQICLGEVSAFSTGRPRYESESLIKFSVANRNYHIYPEDLLEFQPQPRLQKELILSLCLAVMRLHGVIHPGTQ
jgi:hypothetical protein